MATVRGTAIDFAIDTDVASLLTQKVGVSKKADKKEARDKSGDVKAVAFYNQRTEVSVEGLGEGAILPAAALTVSGVGSITGIVYVDEINIDSGNEDFVKTSIKGTAYAGITA